MNTVHLSASIAYGGTGKAFIARVTGRDPKWGLTLEFLGTRTEMSRSKRTGSVHALIDSIGLYVEGSSDKKRTYVLVTRVDGELVRVNVKEETALELAQALDEDRDLRTLHVRRRSDDPNRFNLRTGDDGGGELAWREPAGERDKAIATIRALMEKHQITTADLS